MYGFKIRNVNIYSNFFYKNLLLWKKIIKLYAYSKMKGIYKILIITMHTDPTRKD